jgi:hypothetical protein
MVGQCGLGHSGAFDQLAGTLLALLQKLQNPLSALIAESFEYFCPLLINSFHVITFKSSFLDLNIQFISKKVNMKIEEKAGAYSTCLGRQF